MKTNVKNFGSVTEIAGEIISKEQLDRMLHRYHFAASTCIGCDTLEIACGVGQGGALIKEQANSYLGVDVDESLIAIAERNVPECKFIVGNATKLSFEDNSFDRIILFEAIYYFENVGQLLSECFRVIRPGGKILISQANPNLYDFNPSQFSFTYFSVTKMRQKLRSFGFETTFYGYVDTTVISLRQKIFRPIKWLAVSLNLVPKTMAGKEILKRLVFGKGVEMPGCLTQIPYNYRSPKLLSSKVDDTRHKVLYFEAKTQKGVK